MTAGVDMEMVSSNYFDTLAQQVKSGKVPESVLNEAVRRVLTVKFEKGLFDHPYVDETRCQTAFLRPDALALAREAAARSCVLLKNENGALPLAQSIGAISVIGPLFLVQGIASIVLGVAVVALRWLALLAAGAVAGVATAVGLLLSAYVGLFGYTESLSVPYAELSLAVEFTAAFVLLAGACVLALAEPAPAAGKPSPVPSRT